MLNNSGAGGNRASSFSGDSYKSIAFGNIRCGGRGNGGVILYEKNIATDLAPVILPGKRKKLLLVGMLLPVSSDSLKMFDNGDITL